MNKVNTMCTQSIGCMTNILIDATSKYHGIERE
jgi:hypothetical protein